MSLMKIIRRICRAPHIPPQDAALPPPPPPPPIDAERMKAEAAESRKEVSKHAHALDHAHMQLEGASREMKRSVDALAQLARSFQGRI